MPLPGLHSNRKEAPQRAKDEREAHGEPLVGIEDHKGQCGDDDQRRDDDVQIGQECVGHAGTIQEISPWLN